MEEGGGVILVMQASDAIHLGVDNLNVVRQVGRLLDGVESSRPELVNHSDLVTLISGGRGTQFV